MGIPTLVSAMLINGHNLHVEKNGPEDGRVVLLLHHGLGSVRAWRRQVPALAHAGYRVIAYDRWGYGASDARPGLDLPAFTTDLEDLQTLLDQLKVQAAALVGHSDGGTIALYYASQQPGRVSCLVTVAAHIYLERKMEPAFLELRQSFEQDEIFRKGMRSVHGSKDRSVFYNWFDGWHREEFLAWDMRPALRNIHCPVMIVQGEADEHASPQHAHDIASAIDGAELYLVPGARHMLPQENYADFNPRLLDFLGAHANIYNNGGQFMKLEQEYV